VPNSPVLPTVISETALIEVLLMVNSCVAEFVPAAVAPKVKLAGSTDTGKAPTVTLTKPLTILADASSLVTIFEPTVHTPVVLLLFKSKLNVHELDGAKEVIAILALVEPGNAVISGIPLQVVVILGVSATCS
jgi:hypothetical protein